MGVAIVATLCIDIGFLVEEHLSHLAMAPLASPEKWLCESVVGS